MKLGELAWVKTAKENLGKREIGTSNTSPDIEMWQKFILGKPVTKGHYLYGVAWCGTFVAYCLKKNGIKIPTHWYRALDYKNSGAKLSKPAYGCVAVKTRNGGGHVAFVVGRDEKTKKLVCLGGNQSNMVCYALYAESEFDSFMWYGKTNNPDPDRYNLPIIKGITATKVTEA